MGEHRSDNSGDVRFVRSPFVPVKPCLIFISGIRSALCASLNHQSLMPPTEQVLPRLP